jgi:hypothetical protein
VEGSSLSALPLPTYMKKSQAEIRTYA